jgi:DUF1680 family protein
VSAMNLLVNGKKVASGKPGVYVAIDRVWKDNDEISFTLPMSFRLTKYAEDFQGKETYALEYGPLLMGLVGDDVSNGVLNLPFSVDKLTAKLKPVAGKPLHFSIEGENGSPEYLPYYEIDNDRQFTCYPFFAEKTNTSKSKK